MGINGSGPLGHWAGGGKQLQHAGRTLPPTLGCIPAGCRCRAQAQLTVPSPGRSRWKGPQTGLASCTSCGRKGEHDSQWAGSDFIWPGVHAAVERRFERSAVSWFRIPGRIGGRHSCHSKQEGGEQDDRPHPAASERQQRGLNRWSTTDGVVARRQSLRAAAGAARASHCRRRRALQRAAQPPKLYTAARSL